MAVIHKEEGQCGIIIVVAKPLVFGSGGSLGIESISYRTIVSFPFFPQHLFDQQLVFFLANLNQSSTRTENSVHSMYL